MAALLRFLLRLMRRIEGVKSTINPKIACPFIIFSILSLYLLVSIIQSRRLIGSSNRSIDGKDANSSIYTAFGSDKFQSSLILASIITMPMALDAILDGFMLNRSTSDSIIWLTRLVLIFSVSMPNILLYMGTFQPDLSLDAYFCMNSFVDVASRGCICILLSQINQGDHGKLVCVSIVVFYTAGCYIHLHNQLKQSTTVDYVSIFFFVVAYCQYVYVFAQWATNWMFSGRKIDVDDICMIIYFLGIFIISAGSILITVSHRNELTSNSMALQNYLYLLFLMIVMTFPGQILRFNLRKTLHKMEDKEAFIRYISHEIRTPLNTVFLGMSYIKGELLGIAPLVSEYLEPILDTVNEVNSCCEVALSIVNDLLTFDKLEEGKMKLEVEETEIEKYLSGTILPFNIQAREKNIVISIIIDGADQGWQNSVVLRVDQHKLSQVIRNLVSNAIKFTPVEGTIVVTLSKVSVHMSTGKRHSSSSGSGSTLTHPEVLEKANFGSSLQKFTSELMGQLKSNHDDDVKPASVPVLKGGQYVDYLRIEVKDTGAGISEENQRKLFGQYVQFNASKLQQGNGSGLGLWISKGITELHGGCIGAYSKGEGTGTTFYLELPLFPKLSSIMNVEDISRNKPSFYSSGIRRDYRSPCKIGMHPLGSGGDSNISLADLISLDRKLRSRAGSSEFIYNSENTVSRNMSCRSSSNKSNRSLVQFSREDIIKAFDCSEGGTRSTGSSFCNGIPGKVTFPSFFSRGDSLRMACTKTTPCSQKDYGQDESIDGDISTVDLEAGLKNVMNGPHLKPREINTVDLEAGLMKVINGPHLKSRDVDTVDVEAGLMKVMDGPHPNLRDPLDSCQSPRRIRVLVVDDSMPTRKLMQRVLSKKGYDVQCAEDGSVCVDIMTAPSSTCSSSSLEELEKGTLGLFDVIIMDDNMPKMGGKVASKILREKGFTGMICGVTGNTSYEDERLFLNNGADMVFLKPLDIDLFDKKVVDYVNSKFSSENGFSLKSGGV